MIQKITDNFTSRGVGRILVKWACTGIAASAVDSQTLHLIAMIPLHGRKQLAEVLKLLELYWQDKHYLIIDTSSWSRVSFHETIEYHFPCLCKVWISH